jgi:hypothetical protein
LLKGGENLANESRRSVTKADCWHRVSGGLLFIKNKSPKFFGKQVFSKNYLPLTRGIKPSIEGDKKLVGVKGLDIPIQN